MDHSKKEIREFFSSSKEISKELQNKNIILFLDYDGTLTPIVEHPDLAILDEQMRQIVQNLCEKIKVSIVSGRATDDVRTKVNIKHIFYAGSHGFEIVTPEGKVEINEKASQLRSIIDAAHQKLTNNLKHIKGALAEHVKYTISAHYRKVDDKDLEEFKAIVEDVLKQYPDLRMTSGKKVFELRPKIDWDKGKAVEWILNVLNYSKENDIVIYIGDDTTDEDAFAVLKDKGFGIVVMENDRPSLAKYSVKNTEDVKKVLEYLTLL